MLSNPNGRTVVPFFFLVPSVSQGPKIDKRSSFTHSSKEVGPLDIGDRD